jgi:hypothetical protein
MSYINTIAAIVIMMPALEPVCILAAGFATCPSNRDLNASSCNVVVRKAAITQAQCKTFKLFDHDGHSLSFIAVAVACSVELLLLLLQF